MKVASLSKIFTRNFTSVFIISILLIGSLALKAQEVSKSFNISWMGIRSFSEYDSSLSKCLLFEGARFSADNTIVPFFSELIGIPALSEAIGARIINNVYVPLTDPEKAVFDGYQVPSEPMCNVSTEIERNEHFAKVEFFPFRVNPLTKEVEKLISFDIEIDYIYNKEKYQRKSTNANESVLATGEWYKLGVKYSGVHKITYDDLVNMGINPGSINPKNIRIYGNGGGMLPEANSDFRYDDLIENPVLVSGENDEVFNTNDYVLFYGKAANSWKWNAANKKFSHVNNLYSDYSYYFLSTDLGPGKRIADNPSLTVTPNKIVEKFNDYSCHELDELNLLKSGKTWWGEKFEIKNTWDINPFSFPDIDGDSPVYFEVELAARSINNSTFKVYVNGGEAISATMSPISPVPNSDYALAQTISKNFYLNVPDVKVKVKYIPVASSSIGWLNYIEFNVIRFLKLSGDQMSFRNADCAGIGNISEFRISNCESSFQIWDVTDISDIKRQQADFQSGTLSYRAATDSIKEYIIFKGNSFMPVMSFKKIDNQNLHSLQPKDMIIITNPAFISQAERLKTIHESEGLSVLITTPELIYNEFSSGAQDISALRDFVKMLYDRAVAGSEPKYVLLFGDASYDYKNRIANNTNLIPAFQSTNSLRPTDSYVSDDFFGLMDINEGKECNGTLDLGVGRFPVNTQSQANSAVEKIEYYMGLKNISSSACNNYSSSIQRLGDWRNLVCFIADDENTNVHFDQAEDLANYVDTAYTKYNIDKIYFDAYIQQSTPGGQRYMDVTTDINKRVTNGAIIVNYTGHGGETGWAEERVLEVSDINAWSNIRNLPVFVTATCEFSRYDDPERIAAGEYVFLNPMGGGIALFTTSRLSFSNSNFQLNMSYYQSVFSKTGDDYPRLGEVMRKAKTPSNQYIRNFVLLGDPALRMAYPHYNVSTSTINGNIAGAQIDTIKAYGKVTVTGFVSDDAGNKVTTFNGLLYPTVYGSPVEVTTLGNDPESFPATFKIQKNIIYSGKVSVTNGDFSFTFVVPKDISYNYGNGRISYYAQDGVTDANGVYEDLIIGGSETVFDNDMEGPSIDLYMNDTSFRIGGLTDENPVLIARIIDSSGINTSGIGIGHDIVAVMDDNTGHSVILNDFYEADLNSYQSGYVLYPYYNISNGLHNIRVKIWDIFNNSAEAYTEFLVAESGKLVLENILNYPNPFSDQTVFTFQHNHPCCNLDVDIKIYDVNGRLVKDIRETIATNGFNGGPIYWNGSNDAGSPVLQGMYFYKLRITTEDGASYEKSNKLIVLK